ncbi:MAG: hypothetical protein AAB909_02735 [Patescibacteria group bacterium]
MGIDIKRFENFSIVAGGAFQFGQAQPKHPGTYAVIVEPSGLKIYTQAVEFMLENGADPTLLLETILLASKQGKESS